MPAKENPVSSRKPIDFLKLRRPRRAAQPARPAAARRLKAGGPAVHHGGLNAVPGLSDPVFDQRGTPYERELGRAVVLGVVERQ
jgi:hypothetical protein